MTGDGLDCGAAGLLVPELATGTLAGRSRADTLEHLAACQRCRELADDLARVAGSLLLLAPADDPGPGFTDRVRAEAEATGRGAESAARVAAVPRGRRRPTLAAAVATVAAIAAAAVAAAVVLVPLRGDGGGPGTGMDVRTAAVRLGPSAKCRAVAFGDRPARVLVSVDQNAATGDEDYLVQGRLRTGQPSVPIGILHVTNGHGTLGADVEARAVDLASVQVLDASGSVEYEAVFRR